MIWTMTLDKNTLVITQGLEVITRIGIPELRDQLNLLYSVAESQSDPEERDQLYALSDVIADICCTAEDAIKEAKDDNAG